MEEEIRKRLLKERDDVFIPNEKRSIKEIKEKPKTRMEEIYETFYQDVQLGQKEMKQMKRLNDHLAKKDDKPSEIITSTGKKHNERKQRANNPPDVAIILPA